MPCLHGVMSTLIMVFISGFVMALGGRFSLWFVVLLVLAAILFVVPAALNSSWSNLVDGWMDHYSEAVEEAQGDDDDADDDEIEPAGDKMVRVNDEVADYVGIETITLATSHFSPRFKALATVVSLKPLLEVRSEYKKALAALNVAKVTVQSALQELRRLKSLANAGSVATKKVNYAQVSWREENAKLQGYQFELDAIRDDAIQTWGQEISDWVLAKESQQWQRLLSRQDSLLLVTLPIDISLPELVSYIQISRKGGNKQARKAYFVSPGLTMAQDVQGETYFFKMASGKLRSGMRLDAWISEGEKPLEGVFVSDKAIVWHEGQPWAYLQLEDDLYQRVALQGGLKAATGVFMTDDVVAGNELVMQGAQMLLSEEFRWQILDEDDDD